MEYVHIISKNTFYDRIYLGILSQQKKFIIFYTEIFKEKIYFVILIHRMKSKRQADQFFNQNFSVEHNSLLVCKRKNEIFIISSDLEQL